MTDHDQVRPLQGVRILEFTFGGAAPIATKLLGDFGADVVKVESRTRIDFPRLAPPFAEGRKGLNRSAYFTNRNSSKRGIELDLHDESERAMALRLATVADVVVNNFSAGVMDRLGLGYREVSSRNPHVIYLEMPMTSGTGPLAGLRGMGRNVSAMTGLHYLTGYADGEIVGLGTNYPDHLANPGHALVVVMAALLQRLTSGDGCYIELAQVTSTLQLLGPYLLDCAVSGRAARPVGNTDPEACPYGVFKCAGEDKWLAISVRTDRQWHALCDVIGRPDVADDPRFRTGEDRKRHEAAIGELIETWTATSAVPIDLAARLQAAGVPAAPVNDAQDLVEDAFVQGSGLLIDLDHPEMGSVVYNTPPFHFRDGSEPRMSRAPMLGEHTQAVVVEWLGEIWPATEASAHSRN